MPILAPPPLIDYENVQRRWHPAIFQEVPSSVQAGPVVDQLKRIILESALGSRYIELEQAFRALRAQLAALRLLEVGWDGYHAPTPNTTAIASAKIGLETLRGLNVIPTAVIPSAEGGVGICFTDQRYYAHIEFDNSGEAWGLMYGPNGAPESWQLASCDAESIIQTWNRISVHLQR